MTSNMDMTNPIFQLYEAVRGARNSQGQLIAEPFLQLPSKKDYPDYYQQISQPICLHQIKYALTRNTEERDMQGSEVKAAFTFINTSVPHCLPNDQILGFNWSAGALLVHILPWQRLPTVTKVCMLPDVFDCCVVSSRYSMLPRRVCFMSPLPFCLFYTSAASHTLAVQYSISLPSFPNVRAHNSPQGQDEEQRVRDGRARGLGSHADVRERQALQRPPLVHLQARAQTSARSAGESQPPLSSEGGVVGGHLHVCLRRCSV